MCELWKKIDRDKQLISTLWLVIGLLTVINFMLWLGWQQAPKKLSVYIPPDLSSGVTLKANTIPKSTAYALTFYVWQLLNSWPDSGVEDYKKQINLRSAFLTPRFREELLEELAFKQSKGELERIRTLQGLNGAAYDNNNVKIIGINMWEVDLKVRLTEFVKGTKVKEVNILYPIRVVRNDSNREYNPWGLVLDGFVRKPTRIHS